MYKSPIEIFQTEIEMQMEGEILRAVQRVGVSVDKEELLKALKYDRDQYSKGYEDAKKESRWIPVSERLPEKTGYYLTQLSRKLPNEDYSDRVVVLFNGEEKEFMCYKKLIVAWHPIQEPYKGE